ncbi:MAG: DNA topology modulation protein [Candidatus Saccharimonadales bacterium]
MQRVAIIGSPGTGKSTFARKLAGRTGLPLIHLDFYYHEKQHDYYNNKEAWRAKATEFAHNDTWIIDGNFSSTLAHRFQQADTIFYFNMPTYIAIKGIVSRWVTGSYTKRLDMPDDWQEKPTWEFFLYVLQFRHKYTKGTRQLLNETKNSTIVTFRNYKQVDTYLRTMN